MKRLNPTNRILQQGKARPSPAPSRFWRPSGRPGPLSDYRFGFDRSPFTPLTSLRLCVSARSPLPRPGSTLITAPPAPAPGHRSPFTDLPS